MVSSSENDIFAEEGVSISSGTFKLLSDKEIMAHIFSYYGNYLGSYMPKDAVMSGSCIVKQAETYSNSERRFSLSLDISEVFKPIICDRILIALFNQGMLTKNDFRKEGSGVFLNETGRKTVLSAFRDKLESTKKHPKTKKSHSFRHWLRMECNQITKDIMDIEDYKYTTIR